MRARFLLDTNICIYVLNRCPPTLEARFRALLPDDMAVSVITAGELRVGCEKSRSRQANHARVDAFLAEISVLPLDASCARQYAIIRALLEAAGTPIGNNDLWIAAHATACRLTLVSNNLREFNRVPGLTTENWA